MGQLLHLLQAGASEAVVKVGMAKGMKRPARLALRFRATGTQASGATVVSFATVNVKLE